MPSLFPSSKDGAKLDPGLAALFTTSTPNPKASRKAESGLRSINRVHKLKQKDNNGKTISSNEDVSRLSSSSLADIDGDQALQYESSDSETPPQISAGIALENTLSFDSSKKKRKRDEDDVEGKYLQKLVREEARDARLQAKNAHPQHHQSTKHTPDAENLDEDDQEDIENLSDNDDGSEEFAIKHETLVDSNKDPGLDKASRTVFLANVSTSAMTSKPQLKTLKSHLVSFSSTEDSEPPKIESLRFRSTAYAGSLPKKAAFARKDLMDATTKSTNAYVVYTTQKAARDAAKYLNGTTVLGRHLRADQISHPAQVDHRRCVFVGNLGFVDDESQVKDSTDGQTIKPNKRAQQGDVEEGLWEQFGKAGPVESVRVPRDPKTRVGKGFAYVQFKIQDENSVEAALLFNDKKFPPLLPRTLRVVRAKKVRRDGSTAPRRASQNPAAGGDRTLHGRAKKLFGKAEASQLRKQKQTSIKPPEAFIFEGHRATSKQGNNGLKLNKPSKKSKKPQDRRATRASAWKAARKTKSKT